MTVTPATGRGRLQSLPEQGATRHNWWPLLRLIALLGVVGAALYATAGPPRPPIALPDLDIAWATLRGSSIPLETLGFVLSSLAWLIWGWISVSLLLQVLLSVAEAATHGAQVVRDMRRAVDRVTLPFVRRAVDTALAAAVVVQVAVHAAPVGAEPLPPQATIVQVAPDSRPAPTAEVQHAEVVRSASYTVQRGDTLWKIAERFYGTGHEYPRLIEANVGRTMTGGAEFPETGVLESGWTLRVPLPSTALEEEDGQVWYTVERGDTLWGISARFLGDPLRWPEIFEANRGAALADGRTLRNPNLIWPTLRLQVPITVEAEAPPAPLAPVVAEAPLPVVSTPLPVESLGEWAMPHVELEQPAALDPMFMGAAGTGAAGLAVAGLLMVQRRGRRGLDEPPLGDEPESDFVVRGGFADLEGLARAAAAGTPDVVQAAALETLRYFEDSGLPGRVGAVSARHGRSSTTFAIVSQRLADRPRVTEAAPGLADRLGVGVQTQSSRDHDVLVRLASLRRARFAADPRVRPSAPCRLIRAGLLPDRRVLHVNWPALGHVLVAGQTRGNVATVVTGLVASLAAVARPEELRLVTIARAQVVPPTLARLPHHPGAIVDAADAVAASAALHELRAELLTRMERVERGGGVDTLPEIVALVPELEMVTGDSATLEMLGAYGAAHRMRLVAGTAHLAELSDQLLAHFPARAVLRMTDEAESTRLLGTGAAVDLLGGGQLLLKLDQREPVEVYGFRVAESEIERLAAVLRGEQVDFAAARARPAAYPLDEDRNGHQTPAEPDELELVGTGAAAVVANGHARAGDPAFDGPYPRESAATAPVLGLAGSPIDVRCFGGFEVLTGARDLTIAASPAEAGQRARAWELLLFLAVHPEGVVPREDVLAALWPGQDQRRATAALSTTLDELNALLAPAVAHLEAPTPPAWVDARSGTCRLDLERVESDVHRFARLCRAAALMPADQALVTWARARELYRGDLLDGPGARAYTWVDTPAEDGELALREQYREQFYRATLKEARLLLQSGQPAQAMPLFHALLEVEPLLEDVVRDLYRCHAALGDQDGLRQEDERFRQALRRAYVAYDGSTDDDPDPEPATTALFTRLQQDLELRASVPA